MEQTRFLLDQKDLPDHWYNVVADMPNPPAPYLGPDGKPVPPEAMLQIFPEALVMQEVSAERWIPIPDEVREALTMWHPSPLIRATRLEKALGTPAKIYFKNESVSPAGSHKPNTAIAQAWYNKQAGIKRLTTETGAGQWGCSLSLAGQIFGLDVRVYMVKISYEQKPYRRTLMRTWGAEVFPSPTDMTESGRHILAQHPDSEGSLGIAISEAVEEAASRDDTNYALGSVLNHVLLHQTIIGQEAKKQLEMAGDYPDMIFSPCGGGSCFGGIAFPFFADKAAGKDVTLVAVEPSSCPSLTKGVYAYDFGDTEGLTPLMKMYTLGHDFMPPGIHAGGLRYHGMAPAICALLDSGDAIATAYHQNEILDAAVDFARSEGFIVAPETAHAVKATYDEAMACKESGEAKTILFNASGHGHFDLGAYDAYFSQDLPDYELEQERIDVALEELPQI